MKKFLFTALLLPIFSFSYEIEFNKNFSKVVNPDLLSTSINISVEKVDEDKVNLEIEKFNNFIKNNKSVIIKNGTYTLSPKYKYSDNKQEFIGYMGNLRYSAESKNAKDLNQFMDEIISIKDKIKSNDVKLSISNVSWKISDELQNRSFDELRFESINWIENYANILSSKLSKKCEVKNININEFNGGNIVYARNEMALSTMSKMASDVAPISSEQTISVNPNFILECR
ncbi:SIMPL domain-containing protein [Aliarcobacter butzleri]|uniref:SIMPL domain-containing protein n=1 Tax=Aliarcobacter butzleri TaxID=28197 RepID=UPI0021B1C9EF|nr:SIMPL domain-containing protein [Aliarcobacter butzleri]MCT7577109.1 SIMPL domain-containing protein [Aliarcobacter butzleri]